MSLDLYQWLQTLHNHNFKQPTFGPVTTVCLFFPTHFLCPTSNNPSTPQIPPIHQSHNIFSVSPYILLVPNFHKVLSHLLFLHNIPGQHSCVYPNCVDEETEVRVEVKTIL